MQRKHDDNDDDSQVNNHIVRSYIDVIVVTNTAKEN